MKLIIVIIGTLLSLNSFATSYCYDEAVFSVDRVKKSIEACGTEFPTKSFDRVMDKLQSRNPIGYTKRIVRAMKKVNNTMYGEAIYDIEDKAARKCVRRAIFNTKEMKADVMDALLQC